jgi:hypothetical protein
LIEDLRRFGPEGLVVEGGSVDAPSSVEEEASVDADVDGEEVEGAVLEVEGIGSFDEKDVVEGDEAKETVFVGGE